MLKLIRRKPPLILILVAALVALLGLLATLQYRWLGQVSQGERERMQASLRAGSSRFGQDFNREITRAFLNFQVEKASPTENVGAAYAERYDNWMRSAPYPGLLSELYLVEMDSREAPGLSRFNREASQFEPAEWPAEFASLRERFEQEHRSYSSEEVEITLAPIAEEIPALVIPTIPHVPFLPPDRNRMFKAVAHPAFPGYAIVKLNLDYIRGEFIPALARSYFSSNDGLDYNLAVISRSRPNEVIYRSDAAQSGEAPVGADATANIFDLRLDQFDVLVLERKERKPGDAGLPPPRPFQGVKIARLGSPPGSEVSEKESRRSVTFRYHNSLKEDQAGAAAFNDADGRWQLLIKHRAGSLEAAVASARRRNLVVSFGVLLLLAASVGLILISTARARRLARQQMEFVAGVSHELRTPLAVICSAGENLADGIARAPLQVEQYGALIRNEGRRLTKMVEQVLEFAGAQAGRKSYELRAVSVNELIESALIACQPLIDEGGFEVATEIETGLPQLMADRAALERALQNLLTNAMKYAGESRQIKLSARGSDRSPTQEVQLTVEDQGAGITARDLPHIFEPFYRGQEATINQIHGSGLGLSLVKQTIEAHGGRVTVESTPGRGSRFTLHLPAIVAAESHQPSAFSNLSSEISNLKSQNS